MKTAIIITKLAEHLKMIQKTAKESNNFLYGIKIPPAIIEVNGKTELLEITMNKVVQEGEDLVLIVKVSRKQQTIKP